jgi:hypothetical protein
MDQMLPVNEIQVNTEDTVSSLWTLVIIKGQAEPAGMGCARQSCADVRYQSTCGILGDEEVSCIIINSPFVCRWISTSNRSLHVHGPAALLARVTCF